MSPRVAWGTTVLLGLAVGSGLFVWRTRHAQARAALLQERQLMAQDGAVACDVVRWALQRGPTTCNLGDHKGVARRQVEASCSRVARASW